MMDKIWFGIKSTATIAVIVGCFIIGAPLAKSIIGYFDAKEALYNEQMVTISQGVASKRVEFSNELLKEQIKMMNTQILELVKQRDQQIIEVGQIVAQLKQDFKEQIGYTYKDETDESKDYHEVTIKKEIVMNKKTGEKDDIPWAWSMYSPNIKGEKKWTTGTYPVEIYTNVAIGESDGEGGRTDAYVEAYMTSKVFDGDKDKKFPLDIKSINWVMKPPKDKEFMFNPRLSIGMNLGSSLYPSLEVSFFSYGRTKGDMDWRFLGVGFGADSDHRYLHLAPVEYNIGKPLPLMENLFFAPFIGIDEDSESIWGATLQLPF